MALEGYKDSAFDIDMRMIAAIAEDHVVTLFYPSNTSSGEIVTFNGATQYTYDNATWDTNQQVNITVHKEGRVPIPYKVTSAYTNRVKEGYIYVDISGEAPPEECDEPVTFGNTGGCIFNTVVQQSIHQDNFIGVCPADFQVSAAFDFVVTADDWVVISTITNPAERTLTLTLNWDAFSGFVTDSVTITGPGNYSMYAEVTNGPCDLLQRIGIRVEQHPLILGAWDDDHNEDRGCITISSSICGSTGTIRDFGDATAADSIFIYSELTPDLYELNFQLNSGGYVEWYATFDDQEATLRYVMDSFTDTWHWELVITNSGGTYNFTSSDSNSSWEYGISMHWGWQDPVAQDTCNQPGLYFKRPVFNVYFDGDIDASGTTPELLNES